MCWICKFNALEKKIIVFDEVCHSCGGFSLLCPEKIKVTCRCKKLIYFGGESDDYT